jgi:type II secretory pathway pseudopilin PulG
MYFNKPTCLDSGNILRRRISSKNGFAIIVTLSLMILLSILAVGLLSLSSVALRSSSQGSAQQQARANARLALMLAVGELQAELGPDRRINCQADIDDAAFAGQRKWLGVYDAWNATETSRPAAETKFRRYLVSGDRNALSVRAAANTAIPGKSTELVGTGTLGANAAGAEVRAGLVPVMKSGNVTVGQYAWWIGDENSKAKINAGRDAPATVTPELLAMQSADSAPGSGFRLISSLNGLRVTGRQPWEMGDDLRAKGLSLSAADLLPGTFGSVAGHFHDLSTTSTGLLTDVRNGRLQRDLSLYLEQPHGAHLRQPLYTVSGSSWVNFNPDTGSAATLDGSTGITMEELWLYYNLYKEVDYSRPASNDDRVGRRQAGFPTLLSGSTRTAVVSDRFFPYKRQVYSQLKYMLSLAAVPTTADPAKYDLRLAIDPIVVLWNPNNVAVEYQTGGYTTVGFSGLPYIAEFQTPSGTASVPFTSFFPHSGVNQILASVGQGHAIVLQPGESRVISRVQGQANTLASGWRYTEGTLLNHASFPKNLSRSDTVKLTLRPNNAAYVNYMTFWFGPRNPGNATNPALQSGTYILRGDTAASALPVISTPQTITVGNIVSETKIPHLLFSQAMRGETDTQSPSKSWIWSNPSVGFRSAADSGVLAKHSHQMEISVTQVSTWENPYVQITPGNQAYWGGGVRADFGVPFFTYRSVPLTPAKSLASFQHSCANGMRRYWKDSNISLPTRSFPNDAEGLDGHRYLMPMGSKLIGNSFSHPLIPKDATSHQIAVASEQADPPQAVATAMADHAYLANAALWDSWYFSSLTPQTTHPYRANPRPLQKVFDDFFPVSATQKTVPLPSVRMLPYRSPDEAGLRSLIAGGAPASDAYRKLAAYLMVDGAFNVNSTSVNAWKLMLGSLRGHPKARLENASGGVSVSTVDSDSTPVTGLLAPNGDLSSPSADPKAPEQWTGFRALSDSEIETLATELVKEIRKRGPFLSLSDFVNRRPGSADDLARHGALQAAIEAAGLNGDLDKGARSVGSVAGAPFPNAGIGSRAAGIPGYISQADLLTPLGPLLRARSDTFTVRAYGSATDKDGNILAEAWCEAVVQRLPEYVSAADAPDVPDTALTSPANRTFGRKFHIVGFRWLNAAEI